MVLTAKRDKSIRLFSTAGTTQERYLAWKETYLSKWCEDVIFSEESRAYDIGLRPLRKKDLRDFIPEDRIVNRFEEILRHNNVSDKENAFNRLIALFICKLVDEIGKTEEDEVEFQYKQGTDTYETLQDRLQRLHKEGMETFMHEEIYYVPADYPERLFATYMGKNRANAIEDLREKIRILKYYSNNEFSFKDVHNEELFYQNGKVLSEVVRLFQNHRIVYPSKHQFLGDLFEQLLNKGFKQNEGQFFTPMPVARFIWDSLPLERITHTPKGTIYPNVVDYACGAGHFLTEGIEAINAFVPSDGSNAWVRDHVFGIEKDYRLARTAKISLYMNGAGEGNVVFGDGLENLPERHISNGQFDILTANPPYSVKDFKQHLQLKNNQFTLLESIGDSGSEIETLFVERMEQLLKPGGVAAVILPASILSNDSASYTGAREHILQNFKLRAIVQLGSKTFGATGTNTVVMFLEKYGAPPERRCLVDDCVRAILSGEALSDWEDARILESYCARLELKKSEYRAFAEESASYEALCDSAYFSMYTTAFENDPVMQRYMMTKAYTRLTEEEKNEDIRKRLYSFMKKTEEEKLKYFALTYTQRTVVITAPSDNRGQKEFLGYDWSNRKGNEGIQILHPGGKMYEHTDRRAKGTLAHAIRRAFADELPELTEENGGYANVVNTSEMLDFTRPTFHKAIQPNMTRKKQLLSRYPLYRLGEKCNVTIGGTPSRANPAYFTGEHPWVSIAEMQGQRIFDTKEKITDAAVRDSNVKLIPEGTTLLSFKLSIGKTAIAGCDLYTNEAIAALSPMDTSELCDEYLFALFSSGVIQLQGAGNKAFGQSLNSVFLKEEVRIPIPPLTVQRQIAEACGKIDLRKQQLQKESEICEREMKALFEALDASAQKADAYRFALSNKRDFEVSIGKRVLNAELSPNAEIPVFSANVREPFGYTDRLLIEDFTADSVLWGIDGDWMTNWYAEGKPFYPTDHCGVLRVRTKEIHPRYMAWILETEGRKRGFSRAYRASIERVSGITFSVPPIEEQTEAMERVFELEEQLREARRRELEMEGEKNKLMRDFLELREE